MAPKNKNKDVKNETIVKSTTPVTIPTPSTVTIPTPSTVTSTATVTSAATVTSTATSPTAEAVKAKRGRKSKKELMASLNMEPIIKQKDTVKPNDTNNDTNNHTISLSVNELNNNEETEPKYSTNIYENVLNEDLQGSTNITVFTNLNLDNKEPTEEPTEEQKPIVKKRGRKPKGGKIIQQVVSNEPQKEDKPNVILHLKCSMKDLQTHSSQNNFMESYNFTGGKNDLSYDLIGSENVNSINVFNNDKTTTNISSLDYDDEDEDVICKDVNKEIWKKLKQLEHNLHINNVNNKRSACFWDTCEFDNPPIYIPKHFINGTYHVYGCFCSPECGVAYLMNESIDSSTKFERYHLFNHIYTKIYDYKKNIKPAPNPYYMLERYYGNLSIQEYRSLLRNERLFLIVDKPLTRILPELHEDNDDFILNNKIIPSNTYQVKTRLQRKKQNKTSILNEKFGITNQAILE
jgi:hypothetical protein